MARNMVGKCLVLFVVVGVTLAQLSEHQQSQNFRESVAKAIRDNIARQRTNVNSQFQTINFPGSDSPAYVAEPEVVVHQPRTPAIVAPIVHLPLPVLRSSVPTTVVSHQDNYVPNAVASDNYVEQREPTTADEDEQAKNAHYSFDSSVQDTINGHSHTRQETRDGLSLKGMYSYSDGFFRRTVHYEADEGGYRVTKEEIEPIGDGPRFNPQGKADVSTSLTGSYSITTDDLKRDIPSVSAQ